MTKRDSLLEVTSTQKLHVVPLYHGTRLTSTRGICLALPATLGRVNLAECWWNNCPNQCQAGDKNAVPCEMYCFPVRRKSHRELLSREMVKIDVNKKAKVQVVARHKDLVRWKGKLEHGRTCKLFIGPAGEPPWMQFEVTLNRAVTPETWVQSSGGRKKRRRIIQFSLSQDSSLSGKRQLFSLSSESPREGEKEESSASRRWSVPKKREARTKESREIQEKVTVAQADPKSGRLVEIQREATVAQADPKSRLVTPGETKTAERELTTGLSPLSPLPASNVEPSMEEEASELQVAKKMPPPVVPPRPATLHSPHSDWSSTLFQSTEDACPTARKRLDFSNRKRRRFDSVVPKVAAMPPTSPSSSFLSMPESAQQTQHSLWEATQPQWKVKDDGLSQPRLCRDLTLKDWKELQPTLAFGRAIVDLILAKNKGKPDDAKGNCLWLPSLLDDDCVLTTMLT